MTDESTLLSRRQVLSIFGGVTGAAIVGGEQLENSDAGGNLYGGTSGMAELYQVGPALYKGPLSVRGEVPEETGNDFIQTDGGSGNDQYRLHHYDGGWSAQGIKAPSINTEQGSIGSLDTGDQNNNETNLTRLVEEGTFSDMLDAIANVDQVTAEGERAIIEPGTYDVDTARTLNWRNREIVGYGSGHMWDDQEARQSVKINWTGADGTVPLTIGDGNATDPTTEGVEVRGIAFTTASDTVDTGLRWGNGAGAVVRDVVFRQCRWKGFDGDVFVEDPNVNAFANDFYRCRIDSGGRTEFPSQTAFVDGYLRAKNTAGPSFAYGNKSELRGVILDSSTDGAIGVELGILCQANFKNAEGNPATGDTAVVVSGGSEPVSITGTIGSWDTGVRVDQGAVFGQVQFANIVNLLWDFDGGNNSHNNSVIIGVRPGQIDVSNKTQNMLVLGAQGVSNISPTDVPPGFIALDVDRGGTGTASLVLGENNQDGVGPRYIDVDGTL